MFPCLPVMAASWRLYFSPSPEFRSRESCRAVGSMRVSQAGHAFYYVGPSRVMAIDHRRSALIGDSVRR